MNLSVITINIFDDHLGDIIKAESREKAEKRLDEVLSAVKDAGINAVDMTYWEAEYFGEENSARIYKAKGLKIASVTYFMDIADEPEIAGEFEKLKKVVDDVKLLESKVLMIVPLANEAQQKLNRNELRELILKNLEPVIEYADSICIKTTVENTPDITTPLGSIEEVKYAFSKLKKLGLAYDSANMMMFGENPYEYLDEFKDKIWHVHMKDIGYGDERSRFTNDTLDGRIMRTSPTGKGLIDFNRIADAFNKMNYEGYLALEFMPESGMELGEQLKRDREYLVSILNANSIY